MKIMRIKNDLPWRQSRVNSLDATCRILQVPVHLYDVILMFLLVYVHL
jgi:hypothetical protein